MAKKSKGTIELTKPNLSKVREKIINTARHVFQHPKCVHAASNLQRLKTKYPQVASNLEEELTLIGVGG